MKLKIKPKKFWATRLDPDLIKDFTKVCKEIGVSIQDAIELCLKEFIKQNTREK